MCIWRYNEYSGTSLQLLILMGEGLKCEFNVIIGWPLLYEQFVYVHLYQRILKWLLLKGDCKQRCYKRRCIRLTLIVRFLVKQLSRHCWFDKETFLIFYVFQLALYLHNYSNVFCVFVIWYVIKRNSLLIFSNWNKTKID